MNDRVNEKSLNVTSLEILSKLEDVLVKKDGTAVKNAEQWEARRKELFEAAVEFQYGTIPPKPEFLKVDKLYIGGYGKANIYRITAGTKDRFVSFRMKLMLPKKENIKSAKPPVAVDGDLCFNYAMNREYLDVFLDNGIALALFDRTELVPDNKEASREDGPLYCAYPDKTFGAIAAWAWGYGRCVDALEKIGITDPEMIAFTGHSRGGKTALLAGVLDTRAAIVNPNNSGAGGAGCYRMHTKAVYNEDNEKRSEQLSDLAKNFPHWFGPEMKAFAENEGELPFDEHMLKALVAPRVLFTSEAAGDVWANAPGTYATSLAASPAFDLLDASENLLWYWRPGYHYHDVRDVSMLVNLICHKKYGEPLADEFFDIPFDPAIIDGAF